MDQYIQGNKDLWNEWADINYQSADYNVAGFIEHPDDFPEGGVIRTGLGDITGKSLLHLQCHFGKDTLRLAQMGAQVTGIDFSPQAIAYARDLATRVQIPATFIQSGLYDAPQHLNEQFDIVFTSNGVLGWLPDLTRWGEVIAHFLKPGGTFFIWEGHPSMYMFDDETPEVRLKYGYFHEDAPIVTGPHIGTYSDPNAPVTNTQYNWQHGMADIINALLTPGLQIEYLREYPFMTWQGIPALVENAQGDWQMPPDMPQMPLSFSIRAHKPGA
jgi:SAM-dependent methyltransferase